MANPKLIKTERNKTRRKMRTKKVERIEWYYPNERYSFSEYTEYTIYWYYTPWGFDNCNIETCEPLER